MIIITPDNDRPSFVEGIVGKLKVISTAGPIDPELPQIFNFSQIQSTDYTEYAFSEVGNIVDNYKNDKSCFLFMKSISEDTITVKLYKNGEYKTTITDNTLGKFYPVTSTVGTKILTAFVADWNLIFNTYGGGIYHFVFNKVILGNSTDYNARSHYFRLMVYSDFAANGTVRVETYNTTLLEDSNLFYHADFVNGWYNSVRMIGRLYSKSPITAQNDETDRLLNISQINETDPETKTNAERTLTRGTTILYNNWYLVIDLIPVIISDILIYTNLINVDTYITDYNINSEEIVRNKKLITGRVIKKSNHFKNPCSSFVIKYSDNI